MPTRGRFLIGAATGAGVTALAAGALVLGAPGASTAGAGLPSSSFVRPVLMAHASRGVDAVPAGFLAEGESMPVGAAGAGGYTVQRVGDALVITSATPAAGWTVDVKWNDGDVVKAVFTGATTKVKAIASLGSDGVLSVGVAEELLPPPAAPAKASKAAAFGAAQSSDDGFDGDGRDGWCGDKGDGDGDFDGRGASFDGDDDGDHDGDHDGWDGHRDGRRRH